MGFSPLEITDRLGHESVKTTLDTYSHLYPDKDQQLADRLNQFRKAVPAEETSGILSLIVLSFKYKEGHLLVTDALQELPIDG